MDQPIVSGNTIHGFDIGLLLRNSSDPIVRRNFFFVHKKAILSRNNIRAIYEENSARKIDPSLVENALSDVAASKITTAQQLAEKYGDRLKGQGIDIWSWIGRGALDWQGG